MDDSGIIMIDLAEILEAFEVREKLRRRHEMSPYLEYRVVGNIGQARGSRFMSSGYVLSILLVFRGSNLKHELVELVHHRHPDDESAAVRQYTSSVIVAVGLNGL